MIVFFFFQAEDGIRVDLVTGVQTCALPICVRLAPETLCRGIEVALAEGERFHLLHAVGHRGERAVRGEAENRQIGRASCRERVEMFVVGGTRKQSKVVDQGRSLSYPDTTAG